jgi:hypothetical protein
MILCLKDPKLHQKQKKLLDTINSFSKVARYKINFQKSKAFYIPIMKRLRKNIGK